MVINESLVREALLKSQPADIDKVLTAVEAYRMCVSTGRRLVHNRSMETQRRQVMECALFCEAKLTAYAATGKLAAFKYPLNDADWSHIVVAIEW